MKESGHLIVRGIQFINMPEHFNIYLESFMLWAAARPPTHDYHMLRARKLGGVVDEVVCHR